MKYIDKHISCSETAGLLALYHYGELDEAQAGAVKAHLEGCVHCRAEFDTIVRTLSLVTADMPSAAEAATARAGVMRRIEGGRKSPFMRFAPALAAAALATVAAAVINYTGIFSSHVAPVPTAPVNGAVTASVDRELLENYDLVANMDMLEDMDTLEHMRDL